MGRLRALLAGSDLDREVFSQITLAERALGRALDACHQQSRALRRTPGAAMTASRVQGTVRALRRALGALEEVRRVTPLYDRNDPDLIPESQRRAVRRQPVPQPAPMEGSGE